VLLSNSGVASDGLIHGLTLVVATANYQLQRAWPVYFDARQLAAAKLLVFLQVYASFVVVFLEVLPADQFTQHTPLDTDPGVFLWTLPFVFGVFAHLHRDYELTSLSVAFDDVRDCHTYEKKLEEIRFLLKNHAHHADLKQLLDGTIEACFDSFGEPQKKKLAEVFRLEDAGSYGREEVKQLVSYLGHVYSTGTQAYRRLTQLPRARKPHRLPLLLPPRERNLLAEEEEAPRQHAHAPTVLLHGV